MSENLNHLCRVCAEPSTSMTSLFNIHNKGLMLADMFAICTQNQIQQTDRYPSNICKQCSENLKIAFDFHTQVKASENRFRHLLTQLDAEIDETKSIEYNIPNSDTNTIHCMKIEAMKVLPHNLPNETKNPKLPKQQQKLAHGILSEIKAPAELSAYEQGLYVRRIRRRMLRQFECFMCKTKFTSFTDMRNHLKQHNDGTPYKCSICLMFFSGPQYEQHLCKGECVQCDYCSESFQTTKTLLEHLNCHKEQYTFHKCEFCPKLFNMKFLLECHQLAMHRTRIEEPYKCYICRRGFRLSNSLRKHLITHTTERRK